MFSGRNEPLRPERRGKVVCAIAVRKPATFEPIRVLIATWQRSKETKNGDEPG